MEENLSQKAEKRVSQRETEVLLSGRTETELKFGKHGEAKAEAKVSESRKKRGKAPPGQRVEDVDIIEVSEQSKEAVSKENQKKIYQKKSRLQFQKNEMGAAFSNLEGEGLENPLDKKASGKQKAEIQKKQVRKLQINSEKPKTGKLILEKEDFGDSIPEELAEIKKPASKMVLLAEGVVHKEIQTGEEENQAVEAAHKLELTGESVYRLDSRWNRKKQQRLYRRSARMENRSVREKAAIYYQNRVQKEEGLKNGNAMKRFLQKQQIKREYAKAYRKEKTRRLAKQLSFSKRARKRLIEFFAKSKGLLLGAAAVCLVVVLLSAALGSCTAVGSEGFSTILSASYQADFEALEQAELYYMQLEMNLQKEINQIESTNPGYDEYRYNIGPIEHDPHVLAAYLTTKYEGFTFEQVKPELDRLFAEQYRLETEAVTETRTETKVIQVGQSLGEVVTSAYCSCPICCGQWSGGPTASGAMPQANHTLAVDAANPFVPMGTKIVMNGIEYTVEDTGNFAQYGVQFDIYFDSHAEATAWGHQSFEAFLAEGNENEVEVTTETQVKALNVTLVSNSLSVLVHENMNDMQKEWYSLIQSTKGGLQFLDSPLDLNWYLYISSYYGYRISPTSGEEQLHRGLDIAVPEGTEVKAAHDGTVTAAAYDASYGNYVVIEDKDGWVTKYAHLQSITVAAGQTVAAKEVIGLSGNTGNSTGAHLHMEVMKDGAYYNPIFYVSNSQGTYDGGGEYDDETVQRLFEEAEKYLGYSYVWSGSSPETGFDCSGFVSYVYTASGVYPIGRETAQGIYNLCTPIPFEEAKPGDLIFFTGTYASGDPVTHIGIYAGNGQMLHCGDPIQYTDINTPYWQSHLYGFGRLIQGE